MVGEIEIVFAEWVFDPVGDSDYGWAVDFGSESVGGFVGDDWVFGYSGDGDFEVAGLDGFGG